MAMRAASAVFVCFALWLPMASANDLCTLSDEFNDASTLNNWARVHEVEGWFADQLELLDVDGTYAGQMTLMPHTVVWYQDWRGPLVFKDVTGDFVVTTAATSTARDGVSVPNSAFSLGGIMVRTPRSITPATWTSGGENYVFFAVGSHGPGFNFEVKSTTNSVSSLSLTSAPGASALLQTARLGDYVIVLRQEPGQPWVIHRRYRRADFPQTLQVGLVAYTDWNKCSCFDPFVHNGMTITPPVAGDPCPQTGFNPALISRFDYLRFFRPILPAHLQGEDLTDENAVPDSELLAFLGDDANDPSCTTSDAGHGDDVDATGRRPQLSVAVAPNPSSGSATVELRLSIPQMVRVGVYDVLGRELAILGEGAHEAGTHRLFWNGHTAAGSRVPAGVYWIRAQTGHGMVSHRILRLR